MISRHCPYKPSKALRIVEMHHAGKTREEIAEAIGCSIGYVTEVRRDKGLSQARKRSPPIPRSGGHESGQSLADPNRADKLLRRFSWQAPLPDAEPKQEIDQ